ncbi:hypothetical protein [Sinorhizobium americanum]|uniref:Uncharacterized protein n=1 Tax=Sinorhizobium americanum TaxID=194963 RepID=A0A4R2BS70_9HYPH|nr:hypothetical protein [Sinorhizobium americanum]TCN30346.1 hypothetical protein EV184_108220 [Sinorhizobium americanum]
MRYAWAVLLLVASAGTAHADAWQDIKAFCTKEWPAPEYRMQAHCVTKQEQAAIAVLKLMQGEASAGSMHAALAVCVHKWEADGRQVDWRMALHCYDKELEAYGWLQQRQSDMMKD